VKFKKAPSVTSLLALLVLVGAVAVITGVYIEFGLAVALIVGGVGAVTVGLLVDDDA
jgi:hypothetical protein